MPIHTETVKRVYVTCIIRSLHKWDRFLLGFGLGEGEKREEGQQFYVKQKFIKQVFLLFVFFHKDFFLCFNMINAFL